MKTELRQVTTDIARLTSELQRLAAEINAINDDLTRSSALEENLRAISASYAALLRALVDQFDPETGASIPV